MSKKPTAFQVLANDLASFYDDPFGFVMWAFPWGEEGTLAKYAGPRAWQQKYLINLGKEVRARRFNGVDPVAPIQIAITSGHGVGKSALVAWLILWIMATRPHAKGVVTANTADQLRTKTWAELNKWLRRSVVADIFNYSVGKGNMSLTANASPSTWRVDAMTCREENSEAFAGLHAANSTPFYIFDEASAIPERIFDVAKGGLTDGEPMFLMFGNPTRNTGFFHDAFGRNSHRWLTGKLDSSKVEGTNKTLFEEWLADYGYDSDFYKVRVRGEFPSSSITQLIPNDLVKHCLGRHLPEHTYNFAPRVLGVDVAWEGDDRSCIWLRQGLMAKLLWVGRECSSVHIAGLINDFENRLKTHATFIDAGYGNGVIDQLRALGKTPYPVWFNGKSRNNMCVNKRAEMWVGVLDWLKLGPAIVADSNAKTPLGDVEIDLCNVEKSHNLDGRIMLEKKTNMKSRGLASPDLGDGLALTFAEPVNITSEIEQASVFYSGSTGKAKTKFDF